MLAPRRLAGLLLAASGACCLIASPARADNHNGPVVDVSGDLVNTKVTIGGTPGGSDEGSAGGGAGGGGGGAGGAAACEYLYFPQFDDPGPPPSKGYRYQCEDGTSGHVIVPEGTAPEAAPTVTPAQLAQRAFNTLRLPKPAVTLNPPADEPGRFQIVNFPIWWWVTNYAEMEQRTELGAVWAEVTATPAFSVFNGGQGDTAQCNGAGIVWHRGLPGDYGPACKYVYRRAANSVTATITMTWEVRWVGSGGESGVLDPVQTVTGVPLTVYERQAVNVPYGSSS